jgi:hypothetical protein
MVSLRVPEISGSTLLARTISCASRLVSILNFCPKFLDGFHTLTLQRL